MPKTVAIIFLALAGAVFGHKSVSDVNHQLPREDISELVDVSSECARTKFNDGLPDFGLPSLNPLVIEDLTIDLDPLGLGLVSGQISIQNLVLSGTTSWQLSNIQADLDDTTVTESFGLTYDEIELSVGGYAIDVEVLGVRVIWGEGQAYAVIQNLNSTVNLVATLDGDQLELLEYSAPTVLDNLGFNITGIYDTVDIDGALSEEISQAIVDLINAFPDLLAAVVNPVLLAIFNSLVNEEIGVGIVNELVQECLIDIINPPSAVA